MVRMYCIREEAIFDFKKIYKKKISITNFIAKANFK